VTNTGQLAYTFMKLGDNLTKTTEIYSLTSQTRRKTDL